MIKEKYDKVMKKEISRKKFLSMLGIGLFGLIFFSKESLAKVFLRDEETNLYDVKKLGKKQIMVTFDGGGSEVVADTQAVVRVPFNCNVTGWKIFSDASGDCVIDVWKDSYANFPPTVDDTIAGSEKPTLSSAQKNEDTDLSTWTTSLTEGDLLLFNVDSASTVTKIWLSLEVDIKE